MIEIDTNEVSKLLLNGGIQFEDNDGQEFVLIQGQILRISKRFTEHQKQELEDANESTSSS